MVHSKQYNVAKHSIHVGFYPPCCSFNSCLVVWKHPFSCKNKKLTTLNMVKKYTGNERMRGAHDEGIVKNKMKRMGDKMKRETHDGKQDEKIPDYQKHNNFTGKRPQTVCGGRSSKGHGNHRYESQQRETENESKWYAFLLNCSTLQDIALRMHRNMFAFNKTAGLAQISNHFRKLKTFAGRFFK